MASSIYMKKSFTLIELLIYIALAAIILNVGVYFIWQIIEGKAKSISYNEVLSNSRFVLEKISFEAKKAKSVEIPKNQGDESNELLLKMPNDSMVHFYLKEGKLILERNGSTGILISSFPITSEKIKISEIKFKNLSPNQNRPATFQVKIKLNYYNPFQRIEYQAEIASQKTINLRDNNKD